MGLSLPALLLKSICLLLCFLNEVSSLTSLLQETTDQVFNFENPPLVKNIRFPLVMYDTATDFELELMDVDAD
jgi:hypothetical protein